MSNEKKTIDTLDFLISAIKEHEEELNETIAMIDEDISLLDKTITQLASEKEWLKKLAWFIMEYMSGSVPFYLAFAKNFSDAEIGEFDKLTDKLFPLQSKKEDN